MIHPFRIDPTVIFIKEPDIRIFMLQPFNQDWRETPSQRQLLFGDSGQSP
jgi:hypothetical protein